MNEWLVFLLLFLAPIISTVPIVLVYKSEKWTARLPILSVLGILVSVVMSIYIILFLPDKQFTYAWIPEFGINFVVVTDYLSRYMGFITAIISFFIGIYGLDYMKGDYRPSWYWFLYNLFTASMLVVVYSDNLFFLFLGWEGLGLASWGLIGNWFRDDEDITYVGEEGRKIGPLLHYWSPSFGGWRAISTIRLGDVTMFLALAVIWVLAGNLNISEIEWGSLFGRIGAAGTIILCVFLLLGLFTKSAQVPFSDWLMTAMTGPTTVSALLHSATMVAAGAFVFIKLTWYIEPWTLRGVPGVECVYLIALFFGLVSGVYGALAGSGMLERKVLLAASTMSSIGLMFGAAAASFWMPNPEVGHIAVLVGFWYMAVHAFAKATLFLVSGHLIHATHTRFSCGDFAFGKKMGTPFITTVVATTFLVGIPPLTAYWVKSAMDEVMEYLFLHYHMIIPIILLLITSFVYSGMLAKFFTLNFVKGEKPHEVHIEGLRLMKWGYGLMASMLFLLLYLIFVSEETREFVKAGAVTKEGMVTASFIIGILVLVAYIFAVFKPRIRSLTKVGTFFNDRMYLPFLNDYIMPTIGFFVSHLTHDYANRGIDGFCNTIVMPGFFDRISRGIRFIQTGGYLSRYIGIVLGLVMFILIVVGVGVWL